MPGPGETKQLQLCTRKRTAHALPCAFAREKSRLPAARGGGEDRGMGRRAREIRAESFVNKSRETVDKSARFSDNKNKLRAERTGGGNRSGRFGGEGTQVREITAQEITAAVRELCMRVSWDLPRDVEQALRQGYAREESSFGRYMLEQILQNCQLARERRQAICQDTGVAVLFVQVGQEVHIAGGSLAEAVNEGVRQGYADGFLRKSVVAEPLFARENTGDNTPAVLHTELVEGDRLRILLLPKGAGSENMGAVKMLKPADGLEGARRFILDAVRAAGGNPCPPIVVGVGVGGTMEMAPILAKKALAREIGSRNPDARYAELEEELLGEINRMGIGPQGLGGRVTALDVHIEAYPTHIAMLPVAVNLNCHASRHGEIVL